MKNGRPDLQHLQAARTSLVGAAGPSPYHCARWRRRESLRPLRFVFVVIVIVVGAVFVIVGINIPAPRSGRTLFVIIVIVVIHRWDGLRRVRFE
jgi:drug/metabolite transporter (DMT)-like permease